VIPVLRGFFLALGGNLTDWARGSWLDIMILLGMLGFAVLRWRGVLFLWDEKLLHIRSGLIFSADAAIPWKKVVTVSVYESFYLRPFRAVRLRLDTLGGSARESNFSILLDPETAGLLLEKHGGKFPREKSFAPSKRSILGQSLLNSNSFAGIVFAAAFISQSGQLIGQGLAGEVIGAFEEVARALAFGLPPAAAAIAILLLAGWAVSSLLELDRYSDMMINIENGALRISAGLLTKREYSVAYGKIGYVNIRQSLITKLLGLYSLYISAVGYAKQKEDISCLIPAESGEAFERSRLRFFPRLAPAPRTLAPEKKGAARFVMPAVYFCLGIILITLLALWRAEGWGRFIIFAGAMAMVPALCFLAVGVADYRTGGISKEDDVYTLRYSKGFYLHTVVARADKIVQVELNQSIFQRGKNMCDLIVHTRCEGRRRHRLRSLDMREARKYLL